MTEATLDSWRPYQWTIAFFLWIGFALVAVAGGIFRVVWLQPRLGEYLANVTETVGLAMVLAGLMWLAVPWLESRLREKELWRLGIFWFGLTIAFEFLFGHFVDGASWDALLANYDVTKGRLWMLIPLTMGLGPIIIGRIIRARGATVPLR